MDGLVTPLVEGGGVRVEGGGMVLAPMLGARGSPMVVVGGGG